MKIRVRLFLFLGLITLPGAAQRVAIPEQLTFTPNHESGIYQVGETVGWNVAPGPVVPTCAYQWTIRRNNSVIVKQGKLDLSSGKDKIEIIGDQPEMIYVAIEPYANLVLSSTAAARGSAFNTEVTASPHFVGAILVVTTDSTLLEPRSRPQK
jgi:hypothetical protein